ncbi:hypothetical protein OG786_29205 [Streptomyces sp. NBC_00101]|uniref:hypothetical protein n=1 Tax=Streptomyces sp. NBC_00101 TaxID=2975651 RepID=UPI00324A392F
MTTASAQHIADLQAALGDAKQWLAFAAGHAAAADPTHAEQLMEIVGELEAVPDRTRP